MPSGQITLNSKVYKVAGAGKDALLPDGPRDWTTATRTSQPGDPAISKYADWRTDGPAFNSFEDENGILSVDYTDNVDTRFHGMALLGPKINTVTLSTYDSASYAVTVRPVDDGYTIINGLTPSTGSDKYAMVDESVADDDSTYNSGRGVDLFRHGGTGLPPGTPITKITVAARIRKTATGGNTNRVVLSVFREGPALPVPSTVLDTSLADNTNYQDFSADLTTSPYTGEAWTVEEVDSIGFGYLLDDSSITYRVTQCYMTVTATVPNANGSDLADGPASERFMYVIRGKDVAKVMTTTMALVNPGTVITLAEDATSILTTKTASGTQEVSIGMAGTAYRVITTVAAVGVADTHSANDDGEIVRIFGQAPDRVAGFSGNVAKGNILSGGVTMDAPAWATIATLSGKDITPTGFALDGPVWVWGTNDGPYLLNPDSFAFEALIDEMGYNVENCRASGVWTYLGAIVPTVDGLRYIKNGSTASIGPEQFPRNTSVVQGFATGIAGSVRWLFVALYNLTTNDTYLCAVRPRRIDDPHDQPVSWFTLAKFTDLRCDFLRNIDREGGRTLPTLVGGYGSNLFWLSMGRTERWPDDSLYRYALTGTLYLTEMRRAGPSTVIDLEACEFYSASCTADRKLTVGIAVDGGSVKTLTGSLLDGSDTVNGAVVTNGTQRLLFVDNSNVPHSWATGTRFKPQIAFVSNVDTASPRIEGTFRLYYRERPRITTTAQIKLVLDGWPNLEGPEQQQDNLMALEGTGPVAMLDPDGDTAYWRVDNVVVTPHKATGGSTDVTSGDIRIATVNLTKWPTVAGE